MPTNAQRHYSNNKQKKTSMSALFLWEAWKPYCRKYSINLRQH